MSEKIGTTLTKLLSSLFWGLGSRGSASMYIGCPIDPASMPVDLAEAFRYGRAATPSL